jgi:hypothetical protein
MWPLLLSVVAVQAGAQRSAGGPDSGNVYVKLLDGSAMYGRLERSDRDSVIIVGGNGRLAFATPNVRTVSNAGAAHVTDDGATEYWFPNANSTRLFFGPTGRTLARGEGYFADHELVLGSLAVGVTDWLTIGGGGVMVPQAQTWFITPKIGLVRSENVNVAVGALFGGAGSHTTGGIAYLASTFGGLDRSVTLGVGNAFSGGSSAQGAVLMLGAESRVSRRVSLVTENYLFPGASQPLVSYGLRLLGEKVAVDLAFMNTLGEGMVFPGFPYVDFVVRF